MSSTPTLLLIKGAISELPAEEQHLVNEAADEIRRVIRANKAGIGAIAVTLVVAELDSENQVHP
jgi:hypothetical protein